MCALYHRGQSHLNSLGVSVRLAREWLSVTSPDQARYPALCGGYEPPAHG